MDSDGLRRTFQRFFEERGHKWQPSAPLVPVDDPTLLFTSAGMVQFKPYFMGLREAPAPRLTSIQRCFRTSDIDSVGDTSHHTFFEMMGNFSVGDYFKDEAIAWAWEFYTKTLGLPPEKLRNTVFETDDVAFNQWLKMGQKPEKIYRYGEEDNYWFSGDVGPCGPDSEIFYDFGEEFGCGPNCEPAHACGRFLEIWNLVFMELYQDAEGKRTPLPRQNIDTGAGLERNARVLANAPSTYETDLFTPIIAAVEQATGAPYQRDPDTLRMTRALADHARALTFLIADGVLPGNEGRGYVVRRLIRRSVYYGRLLGAEGAFLGGIARAVVARMAADYGFLIEQQPNIVSTLNAEERRFSETLEGGMARLDALIDRLGEGGVIPGEELFRLYSTYGVPRELTEEIAARRGVQVDGAGFDAEMERERERGRAEGRFRAEVVSEERTALAGAGKGGRFTGYGEFARQTTITGIFDRARPPLNRAKAGERIQIVLQETPFYPEGGGQVGDTGMIRTETGNVRVTDTQRDPSGLLLHYGTVADGTVAVFQRAVAEVDVERRLSTTRNHSGTHLLHAALREVLGSHVRQMGSLVAPDRLRFDYQQHEQPRREALRAVERLVNEKIRQDIPVVTQVMPYQRAIDQGVLAFFGDKYGDEVRVVEIAGGAHRFSAELCGGTHVDQTGQIGLLLLVGESSTGAGVRRVEALTGVAAEHYVEEQVALLDRLSGALNTGRDGLESRVTALMHEIDALKKAQAAQQKAGAQQIADDLLNSASRVDGAAVVAARVDGASFDTLLEIGDRLRAKLGTSAVVLAMEESGKARAVVLLTRDLTDRIKAADVITGALKPKAGINGGGRPDSAQGGGGDPAKIDAALSAAQQFIAGKLGG